MSRDVDLNYDSTSFVGPLDPAGIDRFFFAYRDQPHIRPDPAYVRHLGRYHGGIPRKNRFTTATGTERKVGRLLNYATEDSLPPPFRQSWQGGGADVRLDWSVPYLLSSALADVLGESLIPFASVYTGAHHPDLMVEWDILCFDYRDPARPRPTVVLLDRGRSWVDAAVTEEVAADFDTFLSTLRGDDD